MGSCFYMSQIYRSTFFKYYNFLHSSIYLPVIYHLLSMCQLFTYYLPVNQLSIIYLSIYVCWREHIEIIHIEMWFIGLSYASV